MRFSPFALAFALLISVPLLEIYLLISMGRVIGAGATILVVIVTAVLGAWLLRRLAGHGFGDRKNNKKRLDTTHTH